MKQKYDYAKYECPYAHIKKDCGHELHVTDGEYRIWCACGFRGPVFIADPEELGLKQKPEVEGWIRNPGNVDKCPVAPGTEIEVIYRRDEKINKMTIQSINFWKNVGHDADITWFRMTEEVPKPKPKPKPEAKDMTEKYKDSIPEGCVVLPVSILRYEESFFENPNTQIPIKVESYHPQKFGLLWRDPEGKGSPTICDIRVWYDDYKHVSNEHSTLSGNHPGELVGVVWKKNINERG